MIIDPVTGDNVIDVLAHIDRSLLDQKCLDHGFVKVLDCMPRLIPIDGPVSCDFALADAARISYQKGTRKVNADAGLIDNLIRNQHCYPADAEVLTSVGWRRWGDLPKMAEFVVPNPWTGRSTFETLAVKEFEVGPQQLVTFRNSTTSFRVTSEHRLWFREKVQRVGYGIKSGSFGVYRASACPRWGWFQSAASCPRHSAVGHMDPVAQFIGFYLGDGSHASKMTVSFHLRKARKKAYLELLLRQIGYSYTVSPSSTHPDASVYYVSVPREFWASVTPNAHASDKSVSPAFLSKAKDDAETCRGLLDGMRNSDGSRSTSREQWAYSSKSLYLINLYETLNALLGIDCRRRTVQRGVLGTTAYLKAPVDVESRKSYWASEQYAGKTYCATTSTGLLITRGGPSDCAILSGNTSPIEMGELKFHIRLPIFVMRQHVRHRMASLNEESARYSELASDFYVPDPKNWAMNTAADKQATVKYEITPEIASKLHEWVTTHNEDSYRLYQQMLDGTSGVSDLPDVPPIAREQARMVLGVNIYTQCVWKIDLKNLLHYLSLRCDKHAQYEIRVFADAIARVVAALFPACWASHKDHDPFMDGVNFGASELKVLHALIKHNNDPAGPQTAAVLKSAGWGQRRFTEFKGKVVKAGFLSEQFLTAVQAAVWKKD